jgi:hypothetical protein
MTELEERVDRAINIAYDYGDVEGSHHKMWVIDQMVRALLGDEYGLWVNNYRTATLQDMYEEYEWDEGIAP